MFRGKVAAVNYQWDCVLAKFLKQARNLSHDRGITLARAIEGVAPAVRNFAVTSYVRRMQMINGIFFFAERIKKEDLGVDPVECRMQIFNLQRHLKKGFRRADNRDLIFKKNLSISHLTDAELAQYWFYKSPEELEKIGVKHPRIQLFKEVGWCEPFADAEDAARRQAMIDGLLKSLKANLTR